MPYLLKHYDKTIATFEMVNGQDGFQIANLKLVDSERQLLPLNLVATSEGMRKWLQGRAIPKNRQFVDKILSKMGLDHNNTKGIIDVCKGLSLNDCYWVCEDSFQKTWAQVNLYNNRFSQILATLAFVGYGSQIRSSIFSSPELTTNGMLPKCWRRENGEIRLYKGGTSGFANAGLEPYSEYYASQIADAMGIDHVSYTVRRWKKTLCSVCKLFTSEEIAYMPVGYIVKEGGMTKVKEYLESLGEEYIQKYADMLVFDALICNTDRHFGNFGLLIDSKANTPCGFAPLFDHGASLFCYGMDEDEFKDFESLLAYSKTRTPSVYGDFVSTAKQMMTARQRNMLINLKGFRFKKTTKYSLSKKRLRLIEEFIQYRIEELLGD